MRERETRRRSGFMAAAGLLGSTLLATAGAGLAAEKAEPVRWPMFRGPGASGVAGDRPTATAWSVPSGAGIRWRVAVPGLGHSSPIVWGERVFLTTAISGKTDPELKVGLYGDIEPVEDATEHRYEVLAFDLETGKLLWRREAWRGVPAIKRHTKASHANSTPATDGRRVVAFFGSEGLHAFDLDGKTLWKQELGRLDSGYYKVPDAQWGFGSSPVIHDGKVLVQADVQGPDFLAAFDAATGKSLWRTERDEVPTWSTPTVYEAGGRERVAVNGYQEIAGYDLATGQRVWRLRGGGDIPVPTPVAWNDLLFITNAHGGLAPLYAVRQTAEGEITPAGEATSSPGLAWSEPRAGSYMQTPIVYRDLLYVCTDNGVLSAWDPRTGAMLWRERLGSGGSGFTASAVAADGKLYYTSELGDVHVVRAGREFEALAVNALDEVAMATPAIAGGTLLWRTQGHLVAVGPPAAVRPQRDEAKPRGAPVKPASAVR